MTLDRVYAEIHRLHRENDMFTPEQCDRINDLIDMASRIGPATAKGNKVKPIDKASVSQKIARKKKADRIEKGLRANREKARKT